MAQDSGLKECSLFLVRYVPDPVRGESLNIGIFLHSPREKYLGCLFTDDFRRVKRFHPQADMELLRELQQDFEQQIDEYGKGLEDYLDYMQKTFSNLIQVAPPRTCLLKDPQAELSDLFARYVGPRVAGPPAADTRLRIKQKLTSAFVREGIWDRLEKRIPAAPWTHPGDPFTFDYAYKPLEVEGKPDGRIKFIHALSLKRDTDLAKLLVYTLEHVRRKEATHLTAVVEATSAPGDEASNLSRRVLQESDIFIQPLDSVDQYARSVRRELAV